MKKILKISARLVASVILVTLAVFAVFSVSPIYDFEESSAFTGEDIFDPYASLDTLKGWKKANFHTHTKVRTLLNECEYWPGHIDSCYRSFGYDIVTFSNHNRLTAHPYDPALQVNVYEHGYGLFKYHKLVFGSGSVHHFDHLLPFLPSQRQWQMDYLGRNSDFIQLNHPSRTNFTTRSVMEKLSGYEITELDSGRTTEQEYWDWALSAGHYSFALANDDLHFPHRSTRFAKRCNFLNCDGADYRTIKRTLLSGAYYCMRIPNYGDGDWDIKREMNAHLPSIRDIGLNGDTVHISLTCPARRIKAGGQDGKTLAEVSDTTELAYRFKPEDSYVRFTAYFEDGAVIYSNVFARYDASSNQTPLGGTPHPVDIPLTILFNLFLLALAYLCGLGLVRMFKR